MDDSIFASGLAQAPGPPGPQRTEEVQLSWLAVALSSAVLAICGLMSLKLNLGLHQQLVIAATRYYNAWSCCCLALYSRVDLQHHVLCKVAGRDG